MGQEFAPQETMTMSGDICGCHNWGQTLLGATGIKLRPGWHPRPTKMYWIPKDSSVEVKNGSAALASARTYLQDRFQGPPQTYGIRHSGGGAHGTVLTSPPRDSYAC